MKNEDIFKILIESNKKEDKNKLWKLMSAYKLNEIIYKLSDFKYLLKELRLREELNQQEFAKIIEVDRSTLSRYEIGERDIPIDVIDRILDKFNLKLVISLKEEKDREIAEAKSEMNKEIIKKIKESIKKENI